jgi:3-oxoacyl-[acyl-carrier-protein] synthase-3
VKYAAIGPIAVHFPERVETNDDLKREHPNWNMDAILEKTGIRQRYIAAETECASDLAVVAAEKLFRENDIDPKSIDFVLFCTQTPDYPLPTTACLIQHRLGLRTDTGALDFNLGCSGYVYGLSLADGLIRGGSARRVLLLTGETYSKYIDPRDRSLRTIFGDAGAATLIDASDTPTLQGFKYGTNGAGANTLIVSNRGARPNETAISPRHRQRWASDLYMDGPGIISFTLDVIPQVLSEVRQSCNLQEADVDLYIFHQATRKLLSLLHEQLDLNDERMPIRMEHVGNTVSCTIPILIKELRESGRIKRGANNIMVGFGVGWSWAACAWQDLHN